MTKEIEIQFEYVEIFKKHYFNNPEIIYFGNTDGIFKQGRVHCLFEFKSGKKKENVLFLS